MLLRDFLKHGKIKSMKYYITSGDLKKICTSDNPKRAAILAFEQMKKEPINELGVMTLVSERGFSASHETDLYFNTCNLLEETNQLDDYYSC